jgi:hypothetical protein
VNVETSRAGSWTKVCLALVSGLLSVLPTHASTEADSLTTTVKLINGMVDHGALTRDKADALIKEARTRAAIAESLKRGAGQAATVPATTAVAPAAAAPAVVVGPAAIAAVSESATDEMRKQIKEELLAEMRGQMAADIKRQIMAELTGAGGAPLPAPAMGVPPTVGGAATAGDKPKSRLVRVPYVPESMRREIREQVKQEVLTQAKAERWGDPGALPDWLSRIQWDGDVRLRYQSDMLGKGNSPSSDYVNAFKNSSTHRAPDLGTSKGDANLANTQEDRNRERVQLRLGMSASIGEDFSGAARLTTGNSTDRVSTNQSLGQNFNKYSVMLDRVFLRYQPNDWISVSAGRIPNPWFSTDLVWDEDLNFEGAAIALGRRSGGEAFRPFLTAGAFPIREANPPTRGDRWLKGAQTGFLWNVNARSSLKLGAAYYEYRNMEGRVEPASSFICSPFPTCTQQSASYGQYEYETGLRQKGNTLFTTNASTDPNTTTTPLWGLASRFREVNLIASLDLAHWDPVHAVLIADYVKNIGYDKAEIFRRTALAANNFPDGRDYGYMFKLQLGMPELKLAGDWNAFVAYRFLGSDAVLDAYTDSDFGLGGTNMKGFQIGFKYGLDKNVNLGLKWMSADSIDSMIPSSRTLAGLSGVKTKFAADLLQVDLSARF